MATCGAGQQDFTSCSICLDPYDTETGPREPKGLPCLHSFCQPCLTKLAATGNKLSCPTCRAPFTLPPGGVAGLPSNIYIRQMMSSSSPSPTCPAHNSPAQFMCVTCSVPLCDSCMLQVAKGPHASHDLEKVSSLGESLLSLSTQLSTVKAGLQDGFQAMVSQSAEQASSEVTRARSHAAQAHRAVDAWLADVEGSIQASQTQLSSKVQAQTTAIMRYSQWLDSIVQKAQTSFDQGDLKGSVELVQQAREHLRELSEYQLPGAGVGVLTTHMDITLGQFSPLQKTAWPVQDFLQNISQSIAQDSADVETQKSIISNLQETPLRKGDTWYLLGMNWYERWMKYVGYNAMFTNHARDIKAHPGPIDNAPLFKDVENSTLKENLVDKLEYVMMPEDAWQNLVKWYGLTIGQEPIASKVIEQGVFLKHCKVEVYLMDFKLCKHNNMDNVVIRQFSRADTIGEIERCMRNTFSIAHDKQVRLWNRYMSNTFELLNKPHNSAQDCGLYQGQVIIIEEMNEDGSWPRG